MRHDWGRRAATRSSASSRTLPPHVVLGRDLDERKRRQPRGSSRLQRNEPKPAPLITFAKGCASSRRRCPRVPPRASAFFGVALPPERPPSSALPSSSPGSAVFDAESLSRLHRQRVPSGAAAGVAGPLANQGRHRVRVRAENRRCPRGVLLCVRRGRRRRNHGLGQIDRRVRGLYSPPHAEMAMLVRERTKRSRNLLNGQVHGHGLSPSWIVLLRRYAEDAITVAPWHVNQA